MSTYQPNVNPSSPEGQALQGSIQKQLASLEWSTEDDPTMAEYCLVMLGNRKTPEQISGELSDLIGGDFDPSFVTWLFEEVKNHYPEPAAPPAPLPSATSPSVPSGPSNSTPSSSSAGAGLPARPTGGRSMFGAAVTGVKRDSREMDGGREPPQQRQRFDGNRNGGGKSLFDRMGGNNAQFAPGPRNQNVNAPFVNNLGMPQAAFDAITQTIQAVNSGAHPSSLASIPFPALAAHPLASSLPPPVLAQAQAHAMAQAQAFAQMQNVWSTPSNAFAPPPQQSGFNPQAAPFNPGHSFGAFGSPQQQGGFRAGAPGQPPRRQNQQQQSKPSGPPVVLPKKPELEAICKHGVECTKPQCGYSHPSPVATKESGLVLSSEACEKQLACEDPDCPKSHVSKAQKTVSSSASSPSLPTPAPVATSSSSAPVSDPSTIPGAGSKPCKFGSACSRPGCVFMHPWDVRGDPNGGTVPCRYGAACTRSDCHFSHPPKSSPHSHAFNRSKFSATFNKPSPSTSSDSTKPTSTPAKAPIGDWPKENPQHVSERLKRFAVQSQEGGESEKIIPGQSGVNGDGKKEEEGDKVEIHLDDEDDHKEKEKKTEVTFIINASSPRRMLAGDEGDAPHISVAAGVIVGLLASLVQSFGLTIQRLSHLGNDKLPPTERKRDWQRPLWLFGFAIFILSNVFGTLFQIGALPIVVLGPLGAVSLLWNAAFAKLVLGDEFTVHLVVGTVLIAGGAVLIGIFGVVPEQTHTLPELVALYRRAPFIIWVSLLAFFLVLILFVAHVAEWRLSRYLSREHGVRLPRTPPVSPGRRGKRRWSTPTRKSNSNDSPLNESTTTDGGEASETSPLLASKRPTPNGFRLSFAENEIEADSNNLYSPAPSIIGGGNRPIRAGHESGQDSHDERLKAVECRAAKTRIWVGAAYGATSGTLSGLCLLFTKTGIELLIMSIVGKTNQFGHFEAWLIVIVLLVCELFQLAYLNRALRLVGPTLVCPLAFCFYNTCSIISGLIYYNQWDELSTLQICLVTLGIAVLLGGVWIVSIQKGTDKGEEEKRRSSLKAEEEEEVGRLLQRQERYYDEPESELEGNLQPDEEEEGEVSGAEDDEPLEWRPRGFSIGLAASSPGFDLRPHHHRSTRRKLSGSTSTLPHHSTLDALIRDANVSSTEEGETAANESPTRKRRSTPLTNSRSLRGSLSGSLYVGPTPTGATHGHRRNRSSGTTISLPTTPLVGAYPSSEQEENQSGYSGGEDSGQSWWKFWSRSKKGNIILT
ncbi:uncharacterized protein JCM6883_004370 [Sporobolomyces salmoneus]|uniref:uncharacterized protein n=1 Tax=Sporobolomyces salmoneus TaxID=183962 RepID=UPI00317DC5C7